MATDFGRDTSCLDSLRTGRYATGARLVAEAAYRRLITPRGMLRGGEEEANYGLDVAALVGSVRAQAEEASLPGRIRVELLKDERVETVNVDIQRTETAGAVSFVVSVNATTVEGPLSLVLAVSAVTLELLGIEEG